jgi:hypothetical protein
MNELMLIVRRPQIDRIRKALHGGGGVVSVRAEQTQEAIEVTEFALTDVRDDYAIGIVDIGACANTAELIMAFVRAIVATYASTRPAVSHHTWSAARDEQWSRLADRASGRLYRAARDSETVSDESADLHLFTEAIDALERRAIEQPTILALFGADELVAPRSRRRSRFEDAEEMMWTLRSRLQHVEGSAYLALVGGPGTVDLVADDRAAFFGWGTEVELRWVAPRALRSAVFEVLQRSRPGHDAAQIVGSEFAAELAEDIAGLSSGSVMLAQQLIDVLPLARGHEDEFGMAGQPPRGRADRALAVVIKLNAARLRQQTRFIKDLHPSALPIARALARGAPPYAGVKHATDASRALDALRDYGLAVQLEPRQWKLADPLLAAWIRRPAGGGA